MLQTEFETLTGIFPDTILYEVIEREYNRQTEDGKDFWDNKHEFCAAYKFNGDGLAERIRAAANEAIWRREEAHRKAMQESADRLEALMQELADCRARYDALEQKLHDCEVYCEMLEEKLADREQETVAVLEETAPDIKAQMLDALLAASSDTCLGDEILHMLWGFDYMLTNMNKHED